MACDMIESCIQRTDTSYQQWIKKGVTFVSTDYNIPGEMCAMINVILDAKNQAFKLCAVDGIDVVSTTTISIQMDGSWLMVDSEFNFPYSINITRRLMTSLTKPLPQ